MNSQNSNKQQPRIDKWLWAARFYKTRGLARDMVMGGKVHYNQQRCKPSRSVEVGATITLWQGQQQIEVLVQQLSDKRGPAPQAQLLYLETEDSVKKREQFAMQRKLMAQNTSPERRPDKKQRRKIIQFKQQ
ncbi:MULTISPECIES: ribosome-associated heat shock protein Hsp15 [unclassified Agarivorans]|uniref:ribosome-associated heat shock protein Hsp15 n=1 Tax=unclassified Agarivorans TaxID=2636026 RepID=UPI0010F1CD52|nr:MULTISPECIES: ribosome-associated heat shock protein Hsp15 [unclassified Agarivorans]MDO6687526.1 ribosome-associated heat shock protein Hsp15 [Agarivorans sp. 3_MG-2023]MDO6717141.1 ribosome-associated heat shock protein Hsp15 [Agarivorans sp. 2_MG-2023]MDO6765748.1 ribosome-associated heat shock protein Hsp15 [Agarivorans sp. 1_MG-2023]GDY27727.1 heat shock protein 15 [Agarivorans sp. Toyoura001]